MQDLQQLEARAYGSPDQETGFGSLLRMASTVPRQHRRLPEGVLVAAHQACDIGDLETADRLLSILDVVLAQGSGVPPAAQRRVIEGMVAAYERLWHLRRGVEPLI